MPEANQFVFQHRELLELLVKAAGLHEGKWMLLMNFNLLPGNFGPNDKEMSPGMVVAISAVGLQRAQPDSPAGLVIDASVANPSRS